MTSIQVVDFFSGCGGTSAGLRQAGMEIVLGIDQDQDAASTFKTNFPEAGFICRDIRGVDVEEVRKFTKSRRSSKLLFSACAPCQPFSKQNRDKKEGDFRASLLDELHRFVEEFQPEYIFLENVPGIQKVTSMDGPLGRFMALLEGNSYSVTYDVVDFLDYGIPQTRRRLVLIASRLGPFSLPKPTHGERNAGLPYSTVWEWIGDLPPIRAGESHIGIPNHQASALSPQNLRRIEMTPEGGDRRDWPEELLLECHDGHEGHTDVYGRLRRDRPASTLTTRCISLSNGRFGHPTQHRALSVREAASIQTFPRDFVFNGNMNSMARQIGNAVPVLLAQRFGEAILTHRTKSRRRVRS